jgi:hypothetical protein
VSATIISLTVKPILLDRSLIGISSALFIIMGWMVSRFWGHRPVQLVALAFVASCCMSLAYTYPEAPVGNDLVSMAGYIAHASRPGDAVAYADLCGTCQQVPEEN